MIDASVTFVISLYHRLQVNMAALVQQILTKKQINFKY